MRDEREALIALLNVLKLSVYNCDVLAEISDKLKVLSLLGNIDE